MLKKKSNHFGSLVGTQKYWFCSIDRCTKISIDKDGTSNWRQSYFSENINIGTIDKNLH
jgi:hypothetical protein